MRSTIILISGPSGSGKSSLSEALAASLSESQGPDCVNIIHEDNYYRNQNDKPFAERCEQNYDHPSAFEHELLLQQLQQLQAGHSVDMPVYDFSQHTRSDQVKTLKPCPIIIVEGILLLSQDKLRNFSDLNIYVDTPMDICLIRRLERDIQQRGRDMESVLSQYQATVRPMAEAYILPSRQQADVVLSGTAEPGRSLALLRDHLSHNVNTQA
ncbi:uridine kinase [uncultured Pseudoteredinibacter sp.]|uniref:uridine kinase n=1 Tax=uncultured Pseudoteredinibacter sp. TaxID=1641701 RepID=UPI00262F1CDB|nr:uridine kinase [uncultured Pseudoteredinibacter sp.]